jgi:hypothetical protein
MYIAVTEPSHDGQGADDPLSTQKGSTLDAHLGGRPNPFAHRRSPAEGWSIYGAQRAQPVATGGKWNTPENRSNKPIRNRWQPTATVPQRMVGGGQRFESVRGLCKSPAKRGFCRATELQFESDARLWSTFWSIQVFL